MPNIMRYFTKEKFDWLLADKGLYFSAAEDQIDTEEGKSDHTFLSAHIRKTVEGVDPELLLGLDELMLGVQQVDRKKNLLSCWYLGIEESEKMWETYGKDGVVFFTDDQALMNAFPEPLEHAMVAYPVTYDDTLKAGALHEPLRVKHHDWHEEEEFRFVFALSKYSVLTGFESLGGHDGEYLTHESPHMTVGMSQKGIEQALDVIRRKGRGLVLNCNFGRAIREVRVHPQATDSELLDVENRLKTIGIHCPVKHSQLRRT
ncbi:DUF2971 domain-containing protein [Pseudomonas avellanae]|uniref:DUF2971 domain-containing protein n=1 Tax=Pseudomonas avellanae TaxID=46257 RepID=UPI00046265C2|nr:DUF2971 domain-containing protein [Pseudomonas avellanae]UQW68701.1 DUF2971 domain-containing protein [Pseudomonas avellanae]GGJ44033.1 hypothetical protein GCM10009085_42160 [Pseudomonas avellanae]